MHTPELSPISARPNSTPEQIRKVAQEFESIFSAMMLKAMRKTVGDNPLMPASFGEEVYTDMLDNEYSKMFATGSSLGLASMIEKQLSMCGDAGVSINEISKLKDSRWESDPRFMAHAPASPVSEKQVQPTRNIDKWASLIKKASDLHGVDKNLIAAVVTQESNCNPSAISPKGAKGLMQLMDGTAADMGVTTPLSPWANIAGGTKYLKSLLNRFNGNERLALASYNAGPETVARYGGVPPYKETVQYVDSVLNLKRHFAAAASSEEK
ncbi:MAG: transglycosylase SLT domain-containing protein [Chitinispirillaceae bacterium]|jgi:Rod binding domain-containing protein|nr:transglycosylase SLT domain-containing protein [Chitinispirillaceae bacterium]